MQLFQETFHLLDRGTDTNQSERYYRHAFRVTHTCARMELTVDYALLPASEQVQTPIFLFSPDHRVRFMRAANMAVSGDVQTITLSQDETSAGGVPGVIDEGEWLLIIFKRRMQVSFDLRVKVEISGQPTLTEFDVCDQLHAAPFSGAVLSSVPEWYCGELHTHSDQSTGYTGIDTVVDAAKKEQLDFLAVTDHFTMAHWIALQKMQHDGRPLLLQSAEISGDLGHANVHGLREWINPLVDDNGTLTGLLGLPAGYSMNDVADEAHRQGGLLSINHPLSGIMGWRYRDFDIRKADLFEIYCSPEEDATLQNLTLWDRYLCSGQHLIGVASCDSHHPSKPGVWKLGQHVTWVYAKQLSSMGIIEGLRSGHAYAATKGCSMMFTAEGNGQTAMMGDTMTVAPAGKATMQVAMTGVPAGNLFIILDGTILDMVYFGAEKEKAYSFEVPYGQISTAGSYIRLEYYEVHGERPYYGYSNHTWADMQFLSNPIWLQRSDD